MKIYTPTLQKKSIALLIVSLFIISFSSCKTSKINSNNSIAKKEANYIPYYLKVYEADSLFLTNNYQGSYKILDSLFQIYEPANMENYYEYGNYIASSVMTGHSKDIDEKIKFSCSNFGGIPLFHPDSGKLYDTISKVSKIPREEVMKLMESYTKRKDSVLRKKIEIMDYEDQSVRMPKIDTVGMLFFEKKHQKEIAEIISKYGYPSRRILGNLNNSQGRPISFTTIFLHQKDHIKKKYLPMLLENLKKGAISPSEYADIVDKIYMTENKSLYGSFPDFPLLYPKKIDSIRKTIGLPRYGYENWAYKKVYGKNP